MSKEVYIALIQKDIKELDVIAQGLYETDFPSPTVIKLASSKAMDIVNNLQRLSAVKQEESKAEKENQEKLAAEAKAKAEKEEQERLAAEAKAKAEREEQERLAAEAKAKAEREEQERLAAEAKAKAAAIINDHNKHSIIEEKIGNVESKVEQLSKEKGDSMADKIASSKISSIKSAISIADRFRFQRELFGGNADLMNSTLDRLDACSTIEEAEDIINDFTEWNPEDENVNDFLKLLGRRF
jgi:cell wall-associated NlpC family hydrolase